MVNQGVHKIQGSVELKYQHDGLAEVTYTVLHTQASKGGARKGPTQRNTLKAYTQPQDDGAGHIADSDGGEPEQS